MQSDTCEDVMAQAVDVLHATLSNVGAWRVEAKPVVALSTANIWRTKTETVAEATGALGAYSEECREPCREESSFRICVPFLSRISK
jgi:hypothetical protein